TRNAREPAEGISSILDLRIELQTVEKRTRLFYNLRSLVCIGDHCSRHWQAGVAPAPPLIGAQPFSVGRFLLRIPHTTRAFAPFCVSVRPRNLAKSVQIMPAVAAPRCRGLSWWAVG